MVRHRKNIRGRTDEIGEWDTFYAVLMTVVEEKDEDEDGYSITSIAVEVMSMEDIGTGRSSNGSDREVSGVSRGSDSDDSGSGEVVMMKTLH